MRTSSPIVGQHFRPPAKAILAVLKNGTPLLISREPDNAYDPNAVKVLVESLHIPSSQLDELDTQASGFGFSAKQILAEPIWHLGYIAAKPPKGRPGALAPEVSNRLLEGEPKSVLLGFDGQGLPEVQIEWGKAP
jgi:hypothetical protein